VNPAGSEICDKIDNDCDSDIDDVGGAKAAGLRVAWLNRNGRPRRPEVPAPDYEIRDLTELLPFLS